MESFFILCSTTSQTEIFFEVIDISFNNGMYLIGIVPFGSSLDRAGICTEVAVLLNINHSYAGRLGTRIFAVPSGFIGREESCGQHGIPLSLMVKFGFLSLERSLKGMYA